MEKKKIILELSCELIDKIDKLNTMDDRSDFISHLIEEQIESQSTAGSDEIAELVKRMNKGEDLFGVSGEINLVTSKGISLGKFDIDTLEGFEDLTKKIQEISKDPAVQIRASILF